MNYVLYILALVSLSQSAIMIRLAQAPNEVIGFWRLLGSLLIVLLFLPYKQLKNHTKKEFLWCFFSGVMFFCHLWTYFFSVQHTTIANAMILFATNPLFTALVTVLIFKQKLTKKLMFSYVLAFVGINLLVAEKVNLHDFNWLGEGSGILTAAFYSAYVISGQKARVSVPNLVYSPIIYFVTMCGFLAVGLYKGVSWVEYEPRTWWCILGMIVFPTLLGHALFSYLLKFLNVNWMSCGKLIEPLLSTAMAIVLFHEQVSSYTLWAYILSAVSVVILFLSKEESRIANAKS